MLQQKDAPKGGHLFQDQGGPILLILEVIRSFNIFIKLGIMRHLNREPQREIQKILDLTRFKMLDLKLELKSCRAGSGSN